MLDFKLHEWMLLEALKIQAELEGLSIDIGDVIIVTDKKTGNSNGMEFRNSKLYSTVGNHRSMISKLVFNTLENKKQYHPVEFFLYKLRGFLAINNIDYVIDDTNVIILSQGDETMELQVSFEGLNLIQPARSLSMTSNVINTIKGINKSLFKRAVVSVSNDAKFIQ